MNHKYKIRVFVLILAVICIFINLYQRDWWKVVLWMIIALQDKIILDYSRLEE